MTLVLYNNDEALYYGKPHLFCIIALLCYFIVKRVVSQCDILVLLGINIT